MSKLICATVLTGLLLVALAMGCGKGPSGKGRGKGPSGKGPSCEALSKKVVSLLSAQGDDAMLKKKDIPMLVKGCKKASTLKKFKDDVQCTMKAADLKAMQKCKGANKMIKNIIENAE